jgi:hypothetical protein
MLNIRKLSFICSCMTGLIFFGCEKKYAEVDNEVISSGDNALASQEFITMIQATYQKTYYTKSSGSPNTSVGHTCDTLSFLSGDTSMTAPNLNYKMSVSKSMCSKTLADGSTRSGSISVNLRGRLRSTGTKLVLIPKEYIVSGVAYTCDSIVAELISASSVFSVLKCKLYNGTLIESQKTIKYTFEFTMSVYPNGVGTDKTAQAIVYGQSNGVNRDGLNFSCNVTEQSALHKRIDCKHFNSGLAEVLPDGFKKRTVNYGSGVCDNIATMSVNANTITLGLK